MNGRPVARTLASCAVIVLMALTGCSAQSTGPTPSPTPTKATQCPAGSLQLVGSTAFLAIAQAAATAYQHNCGAGVAIKVSGGDSAYGVSTVRQAVASGAKAAGSMIAMYDGTSSDATGLKPYPMGALIYSVVAHANLFPNSNISTEQLCKIYTSPGVPGIDAVGRRAGSGSRLTFKTSVACPDPAAPPRGNCPIQNGKVVPFASCTEDSTEDLLKFVNGTPNAIGYAEISGAQSGYPNISVLSINNVAPTPENVASGTYKLWTIEHLYASPKPTALATAFLYFLSHYNDPAQLHDFVPCSASLQKLGTAC